MYWDIEDFLHFTKFDQKICQNLFEMIHRECGEIGLTYADEACISFDVYRYYYEEAPRFIKGKRIILKLLAKHDDPCFNLTYDIKMRDHKIRQKYIHHKTQNLNLPKA